jgi:hypothetical protein
MERFRVCVSAVMVGSWNMKMYDLPCFLERFEGKGTSPLVAQGRDPTIILFFTEKRQLL